MSQGIKRKNLERRLINAGRHFKRRGGKHDIWTDGVQEQTVPRHTELNEYTAKSILKKAEQRKTS